MSTVTCSFCLVDLTSENAVDPDFEDASILEEQICSECEYEQLEELGNARMRGHTRERMRRAV